LAYEEVEMKSICSCTRFSCSF